MKQAPGLSNRISVLTLSNCALQLLGFVYRILLSRLAGAEGLGVYRLAFMAYSLVHAVSLSGICLAGSKLSAELTARGEKLALPALIRACFKIFLGIFLLCAFVVVTQNRWLAERVLGDARCRAALYMMLPCLLLTGWENAIKSVFLGLKQVETASVSEVGEQLCRMGAVLVLVFLFGGRKPGRIAFLILLGTTCSEVFSVCFLTRKYRELARPRMVRDPDDLMRQCAAIALPLSLSGLVTNLISVSSTVILPARLVQSGLTHSQALEELGVVSGMAMPLLTLPMAVLGSVSTVMLPAISEEAAVGNQKQVYRRIRQTLRCAGLIGLPATAAIIPLSPQLAQLFFQQKISGAYMLILGISVALTYYQMMTATVLNGLVLFLRMMLTAVTGEFVQLALTWSLAARPDLQIYGYLIAMAVSPVVVIASNLVIIFTKIDHPFPWFDLLIGPLLCSGALFFWVRLAHRILVGSGDNPAMLIWIAAAAAAAYLVMLRALGVRPSRFLPVSMKYSHHMFF